MLMNRLLSCIALVALAAFPGVRTPQNDAALPANAAAIAQPKIAIWRDPGDVATLDLINGIGGKEHAPDPNATYKFIEEDLHGTNPKFDVEDSNGVRWRVKLWREVKPETAASRLLYGAGYFTDEDYYLPVIRVTGMPKLKRGKKILGYHWKPVLFPDGVIHDVRLKRHRPKGVKKLGNWSWFDNPLAGTKEFDGLRVMMALINNWDLAEDNTAIEQEPDGERIYYVSDLGSSFGKTGDYFKRSKGLVKDYERSRFVAGVHGDEVDFVMHSRPSWLNRFGHNYGMRTQWEQITKSVPRAHARWLGQRLALLTPEQIRDCFRSAGFTPDEIERYAKAVQSRIAELSAL